jgi:ABC transport system ATP-binding/permease protein
MAQPAFKIVFIEGYTPGKKIELQGDEIIIGRDETADIVIPTPAVSRKHICLRVSGLNVSLEDLNSSNGTFVNGKQIKGAVEIKSGDRIGLGKTILLSLEGPPPTPSSQETSLEGVKPLIHEGAVTVVQSEKDNPARKMMETVIGVPENQPVSPAKLEVTIAGGKPQVYSLVNARYSVGRAAENDIVIASQIVSRYHFVLVQTPQGYRLEVLKDITNPVLQDGRQVSEPVILHHQNKLRIGGDDPGVMVTLNYLNPAEAAVASPLSVHFGQKEKITLGRDAGNEVSLDSPLVSRFHAQIERVGQRYRVIDLRSANGTFVNDKRVEGEVWLQAEDTIRIGPYRFVMGRDSLMRHDDTRGLRVEITGLNKWVRKDLNLLKNLSLLFQPREFVVVVGQSGGGKSTLVDAVAGYRPATHGHVLVNGIDVYKNFDAIRNEIGFVPQRDIIHMELTVWQALDYAARLRMPPDTTQAERHKRMMEVLEDLDLVHRKDVQISGLSGGQQKRVSIGVELLTSPGLFFLDEPTSGLDPGTETALMQLMRRLADRGRTIILITHATKNVMLADKVVFLARGGYLAWFGPPDEALEYFDQYRSERDRRARAIEFDQIYAILDDQSKGSAEDWAKRFQAHPAYQKYITRPLTTLGHTLQAALPQASAASQSQPIPRKVEPVKRRQNKQVSALRQFLILSARNVRILTRDRPSMVLMLAVGPIIAMLDVVLSFVLGRDLFNYKTGNIANVVTSLFMPIMYAVMVGSLAQMREFVKESEIYKRERLVNLKVLPYVLSKVWVAAILALYQAFVYTLIHYLAFKMPGGVQEFLLAYMSLYMATLAGMMLGLASSAIAPNANAVPLIVIMFLVPQFTLGGAMIPVPDFISGPTSARWAFEGLMAISGVGSDVAADACWELPKDLRKSMSLADKDVQGCKCMGINVLRQSSCDFPGIGDFYKPVVDQPEPVKPGDIGLQPTEPAIPPPPQEPGKNATTVEMSEYLLKLKDYQAEVGKIQNRFKAENETYQAKADVFARQMEQYQKDLAKWEIDRNSAVSSAEGLIEPFHDNFKWTFVDKHNQAAYLAKIINTWVMQGVIIFVLMTVAILLIWRKDKVT